jgi:hypothetical protein
LHQIFSLEVVRVELLFHDLLVHSGGFRIEVLKVQQEAGVGEVLSFSCSRFHSLLEELWPVQLVVV